MAVREPLIASCVADKAAGDESALVPWWSIAKTAIAACALVLVAGGRLDLDRTMPGRRFTLRQLLQHTGGLPCYTESDAYEVAVERHCRCRWGTAKWGHPGQAFRESGRLCSGRWKAHRSPESHP